MKITLYTISDCQFSKQEKEYLNANKLSFEEKNLETNKDFLTEMLALSNNFAGTPVTRVEKDDGSIAVLKGFTKEEFDTTFGFVASPTNNQTPTGNGQTPVPANDTPTSPAEVLTKTGPTDSTVLTDSTIPSVPVPVETPVVATPDPLKSVMDDLQSKSEPTLTTPPTEQPAPTTDNPPVDAPTIPDFPAK